MAARKKKSYVDRVLKSLSFPKSFSQLEQLVQIISEHIVEIKHKKPAAQDQLAKLPLDLEACKHIPLSDKQMEPMQCTGDGSCLFNAVSILLYGNEKGSKDLRLRTILELVKNADFYVSSKIMHLSVKAEEAIKLGDKHDACRYPLDKDIWKISFEQGVIQICGSSSESSDLTSVYALVKILKIPIRIVCPDFNNMNRKYIHRVIEEGLMPNEKEKTPLALVLFRTGCYEGYSIDKFYPNHFVPLRLRTRNVEDFPKSATHKCPFHESRERTDSYHDDKSEVPQQQQREELHNINRRTLKKMAVEFSNRFPYTDFGVLVAILESEDIINQNFAYKIEAQQTPLEKSVILFEALQGVSHNQFCKFLELLERDELKAGPLARELVKECDIDFFRQINNRPSQVIYKEADEDESSNKEFAKKGRINQENSASNELETGLVLPQQTAQLDSTIKLQRHDTSSMHGENNANFPKGESDRRACLEKHKQTETSKLPEDQYHKLSNMSFKTSHSQKLEHCVESSIVKCTICAGDGQTGEKVDSKENGELMTPTEDKIAIGELKSNEDFCKQIDFLSKYYIHESGLHVFEIAKQFLKSLDIPDTYFNHSYDVCFCQSCHMNRGDKIQYLRGNPPKNYSLPIGWCKFALWTKPQAKPKDIFNKWHVAFHGTRVESVEKILNLGDLLMPGDFTPSGIELNIPPNHWDPANPKMKPPRGFDVRKIYFSPSIKYAGCKVYSPARWWRNHKTGTDHTIQMAFQVYVEPGTYEVSPQTIGARNAVDPMYNNSELEWSTKRRGVVFLVGLLVQVDGEKLEKGLCNIGDRGNPAEKQEFIQ